MSQNDDVTETTSKNHAAPLSLPHRPDSAVGDRTRWVKAELGLRFVEHVRSTLILGVTVMPVAFVLMWGHVNSVALVLWMVFGIFFAALRWSLVMHFHRVVKVRGEAAVIDFLSKIRWTWGLVPVHWGLMTWLFYGRVPLGVAFVLLTIMVGIGTTAVYAFAADKGALRIYIWSLLVPSLGAFGWAVFNVDPSIQSWYEHAALMVCASVYAVACRNAGVRNHAFQRDTLGLQYDNEGLIRSLDLQTRQTQDAMASRSRLLAGAAHDLRQPVHALSLYADWLREEPEMIRDITPKIIESTAAINRLFDGLFDLAQLDQQRGTHTIEPVELKSLLAGLCAQYGAQAQTKGLSLRSRAHAGYAYTDATAIRRIVGNLIDNAIKYTDLGGVLVTCRLRKHQWHIEIWDTGVGIATQDQATIFAEFYRVKSHDGTQDSFGLGLAIVQRLAKRVGATIAIKSHVGRGSRFTVNVAVATATSPKQLHSFSE